MYPRHCPVCGEIASPPGRLVCDPCLSKIPYIETPRCLKCGRHIEDQAERLCPDCTVREKSFSYGISLCDYDDLMQRVVTDIKYRNRREYILPLAALFWRRHGKELLHMNADALVPVPVHPSRRRMRGFNQAELLAAELSRFSGIPLRPELLVRSRKTEAQKELTPDERVHNLSEAFHADPLPDDVRRIILVDDIYTTGSTVEACTRCLLSAGAGTVFFAALCIVPEA